MEVVQEARVFVEVIGMLVEWITIKMKWDLNYKPILFGNLIILHSTFISPQIGNLSMLFFALSLLAFFSSLSFPVLYIAS